MGIWGWLLLLAGSAVLATGAQIMFQRSAKSTSDYDWVYTATGALVGGFTANAWYGDAQAWGPVVDGFYVVPAMAGALIAGVLAEIIYRVIIRPRQSRA